MIGDLIDADDPDDATFVANVRRIIDARPLDDSLAPVLLRGPQAARLLLLAEEALCERPRIESGLWTRNLFVDEEADVGVKISQLANALTVWAMMRGQSGTSGTVGEAMAVFNTTQDVIEEAVREGHWLYQVGSGLNATISVDGE